MTVAWLRMLVLLQSDLGMDRLAALRHINQP
jgi:hypothetical protein